MKRKHLYLLAILSGILLSVSWPVFGFPPILFIAIIPLLFVEDYIANNNNDFGRYSIFKYAYITFFIFNLTTTWWLYNASFFGVFMALVFNSLFFVVIFTLFHITKKATTNKHGYLNFVFFWIAFEYVHIHWDLSWTWLNLGNAFASTPSLIQWYEYTGVFGGTLWVLVANILIFLIIKKRIITKQFYREDIKPFLGILCWILIPIAISLTIYYNYEEVENPFEIVVIQPNIDPYNEKFGGMIQHKQTMKMISLAKKEISPETDFVIGPETAIIEGIWENRIEESHSIITFRKFLNEYPYLKLIIGIDSRRMYSPEEKPSSTARNFSNRPDIFYDSYNTAILMDTSKEIGIYHKSKLVIGVEMVPFSKILKPLEALSVDMGGTTGSLGIQKDRSVLSSSYDTVNIAPCVCYESIFGEFMSEFVRNGAHFIFIITNDGWWGDTHGYKQHFEFARLRAIETRRSVARSANTGTSGFINQRGDVLKKTNYWEADAIKTSLNANTEITFYTRFGNYIARIAVFISIFSILFAIKNSLIKRKSTL